MDYQALPKVELHLHLDCSVSYPAMAQLEPRLSEADFARRFVAPEKCLDLADYLVTTVNGVEMLQSEHALRLATLDLFEQLQRDGLIYAEIRFAPLLHTERGLAAERVVEVVAEAAQQGMAQTGVTARLLLCTLRHFTETQSLQTVELLQRYQGDVVAGLDLAADEAGFPLDAHLAAFRLARDAGLPITAHAGEARGPESVWETLAQLQPRRIGHGVRSIEDPRLMEYLAEVGVHLEICPTCNVQIDLYDTYAEHPIERLYRYGVHLNVNTDARTTTPITLTEEYARMARTFGWGLREFLQSNRYALQAAFIPDDLRQSLMARLEAGNAA